MGSNGVFRAGFVAIVGRPNAGKSTLANTLVGRKVSIVSSKPQTTRNRIQGILNREDAQIVLVDTPGIHKPANVLNRMMMDEALHALEGVDVLSLIADASADFGPGDKFSIEWIRRFHGPIFRSEPHDDGRSAARAGRRGRAFAHRGRVGGFRAGRQILDRMDSPLSRADIPI